jgi:hypothetical protein
MSPSDVVAVFVNGAEDEDAKAGIACIDTTTLPTTSAVVVHKTPIRRNVFPISCPARTPATKNC